LPYLRLASRVNPSIALIPSVTSVTSVTLIVLYNNHVIPVVIMMVVMLGMHDHHISLVSDNDGVSLDKRSKCQESGTNYNNFHIHCIRWPAQLTAIPI
jgi:hypothetical protein